MKAQNNGADAGPVVVTKMSQPAHQLYCGVAYPNANATGKAAYFDPSY
jgi:hypothetical protein